MARDEAYWEAERRIEETRRKGATTLDLIGWGLTEVPKAITSLTQLTELKLSYNQLTSIPEAITSLTQLTVLNLSSNQLTSIPEEIASLTQLTVLNLSYNQLTSIPEEIASLTQLTVLNLYKNQLTSIPEAIASLTHLRELNLSSNQLTSIPEAIGLLTQLTTLDIARNQLARLPNSITFLPRLTTIILNGNPLELELAAAYEQGVETLFQFLRAKSKNSELCLENNRALIGFGNMMAEAATVQATGTIRGDTSVELNEVKLILIGEGEVGKTSLLSALRGDAWVENRATTHGVEVDIKSLIVTDPDSGKEITFNGWDFGGQNIYRHTHQLFFTSPAIYLAVWNPRRGPEQCRVDEWIKMVKHRAYDETQPDKKPHILVVATHGGPKERLDYIDEQAFREEFGDLIVGFYHVDSKTGYSLDELKQAICRTAANLPQVGRSVPASWKQVLDAIRQRSQNDAWITYEQFQTLCTAQNVDLADG